MTLWRCAAKATAHFLKIFLLCSLCDRIRVTCMLPIFCCQVNGAAQVGAQSAGHVERRERSPAAATQCHRRTDAKRPGCQARRVPRVQGKGKTFVSFTCSTLDYPVLASQDTIVCTLLGTTYCAH